MEGGPSVPPASCPRDEKTADPFKLEDPRLSPKGENTITRDGITQQRSLGNFGLKPIILDSYNPTYASRKTRMTSPKDPLIPYYGNRAISFSNQVFIIWREKWEGEALINRH